MFKKIYKYKYKHFEGDEENRTEFVSNHIKEPLDKYIVHDIFVPSEKDMRIEYPELNDMPEFNDMPDADIRFCWYYACKSSPFVNKGYVDRDRMYFSIKEAYGENYTSNKQAMALFVGEFSQKIIDGINRMKNFSPGIRSRANSMIERIMSNMEMVVMLDATEMMVMSAAEKKAFISLCVDVSNNLPVIVNQLEGGFSVSKSNKAKKEAAKATATASAGQNSSDNLMDRVVSLQEEDEDEY